MKNLEFKLIEAPDAKSFDIIVTKPASVPTNNLRLVTTATDGDNVPFISNVNLPDGFGTTILKHTVGLEDIATRDLKRFEDGVYWFFIEQIGTPKNKTEDYGVGFLAIITNLIRLQNLNLDHRHSKLSEIEDAHFCWMIFQCAVWSTEIGQTRLFIKHVDHLKKLLPYLQEINENYDIRS